MHMSADIRTAAYEGNQLVSFAVVLVCVEDVVEIPAVVNMPIDGSCCTVGWSGHVDNERCRRDLSKRARRVFVGDLDRLAVGMRMGGSLGDVVRLWCG